MHRHAYRFSFDPSVSTDAVEAALNLSLLTTECLYGESAVLIEAHVATRLNHGVLVIDAATPVGLAIGRIFAGLMQHEVGNDMFVVEVAGASDESHKRDAA